VGLTIVVPLLMFDTVTCFSILLCELRVTIGSFIANVVPFLSLIIVHMWSHIKMWLLQSVSQPLKATACIIYNLLHALFTSYCMYH
jgi:hypothetical protein